MTRKSSTTDVEAELRAAFAVFDSDNSGCIDAKELKSVMSSIGENLTDAEIDEMIKMADTDGDGNISCELCFLFSWSSLSWFLERTITDRRR